MNSPSHTPEPGASKTLWAAALVLVVVVLAMGAALIRIQNRPIEPRLSVLPAATPLARTAVPVVSVSSEVIEQNRHPALINKAQDAIKNEAKQANDIATGPRPVLPRQPEPAVARPAALDASTTPTAPSR